RRRHTRFSRDWSSDVCSSDLGLPKERIEIFCDGEAYIVDDFKALIRASDGSELWKSRTADKGHFEELSLLADGLLNKTGAPIPRSEERRVGKEGSSCGSCERE